MNMADTPHLFCQLRNFSDMPAADQKVSQKAIRTRIVHASHSCWYPNLSLTNAATVVMFPSESTRVVFTSPSWLTTTLYSVQLICN